MFSSVFLSLSKYKHCVINFINFLFISSLISCICDKLRKRTKTRYLIINVTKQGFNIIKDPRHIIQVLKKSANLLFIACQILYYVLAYFGICVNVKKRNTKVNIQNCPILEKKQLILFQQSELITHFSHIFFIFNIIQLLWIVIINLQLNFNGTLRHQMLWNCLLCLCFS